MQTLTRQNFQTFLQNTKIFVMQKQNFKLKVLRARLLPFMYLRHLFYNL